MKIYSANANALFLYDTLESTNITAKETAAKGAAHGTVIIADSQTAGKGRKDRVFHSPPGHGIYMSLVLRPELLPLETLGVTAFAAVSVCASIEALCGKKPQLKWVNDIFLDGKKICGITADASTDGGSVSWIVLGIGINFSTPAASFPEELRNKAGSIFPEGEPPITRDRLASDIIDRLLAPGRETDIHSVMKAYKGRMMMLGRRVTVHEPSCRYYAVAEDIDDAGRLIVTAETGERRVLQAGEISILI